jgi:hypothetical protein
MVQLGTRHSDTDFSLRGGLGIEYYLTDGAGLMAEGSFVAPMDEWDDNKDASFAWGFFLRF